MEMIHENMMMLLVHVVVFIKPCRFFKSGHSLLVNPVKNFNNKQAKLTRDFSYLELVRLKIVKIKVQEWNSWHNRKRAVPWIPIRSGT
jgi:hypothetical protein